MIIDLEKTFRVTGETKKLTISEKLILAVLKGRKNGMNECAISNQEIAEILDLDVSNVSRSIGNLKIQKKIRILRGGWNRIIEVL